MTLTLYNARVITPEEIYAGGVVLEGGKIVRLFRGDDHLYTGRDVYKRQP